MDINQLETKEQYYQCLHDALKHMASIIDRGELEMPMDELASACGVSLDRFIQHFPSMDILLQNIIDRMTLLFERHVQNQILTCTFMHKNKVTYFLRCVNRYFEKYPEAGYLFTMSFLGDVMVSDVYPPLENYAKLWYETLFGCLSTCTQEPLTSRITETYMTSLKGQCQLVNINNIVCASAHAERFLLAALTNC